MDYKAHNDRIFNNILNRFNELLPEIGQVMATTAREYMLDQFDQHGGDYGQWPDKVSGDMSTMYDTGNLYNKLREIDAPGNFEIENEGVDTIVKLHVDVKSPKGFDYGAYQQIQESRIFFEISYELSEKMREVVKQELGKLPGHNLLK